ncbi:hypothetical protein ANT_20370 [Anaerolinea thermophila UNI-1]|uniref:Uncharacterized protein n=1 Tax=Anaerolinea thermophila (strain DSM 14523 / JCM 11388 / NBRC 100420 / UNI-1) TaxID=926569 RepID=E8MXI2_ANATU|nr:hypothetical protein ANT_20370 [Anaerolinea thermophila UNI-1]
MNPLKLYYSYLHYRKKEETGNLSSRTIEVKVSGIGPA